jgi:cob(I)alamin adenosyltransferase
MKIYTKTGDAGETGLFGGPRVMKNHDRIEAYGEVDELNSYLGFARSQDLPRRIDQIIARIQSELFSVGAELATPNPPSHGTDLICSTHIRWLEEEIDRFEQHLEPLKNFILPDGIAGAASLHVARSVCRRAERKVVALAAVEDQQVSSHVLGYLNRLSDLLFVLARAANHEVGFAETAWTRDTQRN